MRRSFLLLAFSAIVGSCNGPTEPSAIRPTITGITPAAGSTSGGTSVTISGTNFAAGSTVTIGGVPATQVTLSGPTTLTAVTGARAAGVVDVAVMVDGETATLAAAFTYVAPSSANSPPSIQSINAQGSRQNQPPFFADLNEAITLAAAVSDAETAASGLIYDWAAPAGTLQGTGASVTWRAPESFPTPGTVAITLTVIDRYTSPGPGGTPVQHEHRVTGQVLVKVHDSIKEVGDMARKFLLLFSDSNVAPEVVVQDFLPGCGAGGIGRELELNDVVENRAEVTITQHNIGPAAVSINFGGICAFRRRAGDACVQVPVEWRDIEKSTGLPGHTQGTEYLTAIYNGTRWGLCDAEIEGTHVRGGLPLPISLFRK